MGIHCKELIFPVLALTLPTTCFKAYYPDFFFQKKKMKCYYIVKLRVVFRIFYSFLSLNQFQCNQRHIIYNKSIHMEMDLIDLTSALRILTLKQAQAPRFQTM